MTRGAGVLGKQGIGAVGRLTVPGRVEPATPDARLITSDARTGSRKGEEDGLGAGFPPERKTCHVFMLLPCVCVSLPFLSRPP